MGAADSAAEAAGPEDDVSTLHRIVSSIGPKLRDLRLQRGLSLQQVAERADVSAAAIHKIEKSGMVPTITTLLKLAGAVATVEPGASSGAKPMEHPGEELVFVLEGALEFDVDGQGYRLAEGDSVHFRTDRPHRWKNPGKRPARAVWMALRPL